MTVASVSGVALAVVAIVGLVVALLRWFFTRGADEREMEIAVRDNTEATRELSKNLGDFTAVFHDFRASVTERFHEHDVRLTKLEAPLQNHDIRSPDRNASPKG